jgi:hypothetical protein
MSLNIGDLVRLYRRTNPGLGVVVEYITDISFYCANGMDDILTLNEQWNDVEDYSGRNQVLNSFLKRAKMPNELSSTFLLTNGYYKYTYQKSNKNPDTIKLEYVKVLWILNPSDYTVRVTRKKEEWYPVLWLKEIKPPQTS